MASISLFREQLSGPKATPFPAVLEPVSFYQRSHFLITVRRGEWLSWCLLTSQSTSWPPGSLSTCGSSHPSLPPKPLQLTGSPYPASYSLTAYHLCYLFSWSPVFVFFYCPPPWSPLPAVSPPHPHKPWPGPVCCRYSVYYFLSLFWALREAPGCTLLQIKNNIPWSSHVLSLCICCQNP